MLSRSRVPGGGIIGLVPPSKAAGGAGRAVSRPPEAPDHPLALGTGDLPAPGDLPPPGPPAPCPRPPDVPGLEEAPAQHPCPKPAPALEEAPYDPPSSGAPALPGLVS